MSFRCQLCKTPQKTGVSAKKVVLKTRPASYQNFYYEEDPETGRDIKRVKDSNGLEIVKEVLACVKCAAPFEPAVSV